MVPFCFTWYFETSPSWFHLRKMNSCSFLHGSSLLKPLDSKRMDL